MNLFTALSKEKEKGNDYLYVSGEIISAEKRDSIVKKMYFDGVKSGAIDFTKVTYEKFYKEEIKKFKKIDFIEGIFRWIFDGDEEEVKAIYKKQLKKEETEKAAKENNLNESLPE